MTSLDLLQGQLRRLERELKHNQSWIQHDHIADKIEDVKQEIMREITKLESKLVQLKARLETAVCSDMLEIIEDDIIATEGALTIAKLKL